MQKTCILFLYLILEQIILKEGEKKVTMKEKDMTEKMLLDYNDVFADILNVVYFNGEEVVGEEDLTEATEITRYKDDNGRLHEQTRDLAKFWKKEEVIFSFFGVENQTKVDKNMILRVISYDGATYRKQLNNEDIYPVQTLVIYWGKDRWTAPLSLKERIGRPEEIKKLFSDYSYRVVEIARMSEEVRRLFKSDFRQVAEIIAKGKDYEPSDDELKHPEETLNLLGALVRDERYKFIKDKLAEVREEGRKISMCELLDKIENRGIEFGKKEGRLEGRLEGRFEGESRMSKLFLILMKEGKITEAKRAAEEDEFREKMFKEYGI